MSRLNSTLRSQATSSVPEVMDAVAFDAFGGPEILRMARLPVPLPGAGQVLIEVHAVSVNRTLDCALRAGDYVFKPDLPHVPGVDASGVVAACGPDVEWPPIGTRVVARPIIGLTAHGAPKMTGVHVWGGYAEYVLAPAANLHVVPYGLDFATATVVARHFPLAFTQLRDHGQVKAGDWVLVMGAAGGLGSAAVQAALYLGANVIAGAGADERVASAIQMGAQAGVNYRTQRLDEEVARITLGRGVNLVLDNLGDPDLFPLALKSLAHRGRLVTAGAHAGGQVPLDVKLLYQRQISIIGAPVDTPQDYDLALRAAGEGQLKISIAEILPLSEAAKAHARAEANDAVGKIILTPRPLERVSSMARQT